MKKLLCPLAGIILFSSANFLPASELDASYQVIERGQDYRVLQRLSSQTNELGQVHTVTNRYTELETGMHYLRDGQWVESNPTIELTPNGAVARQGAHQVNFAANINSPVAVELVTPDQKHLRSHILGLSYYDSASKKSVLIAELKDATGQLISSNQVIYPDSFTDFHADVRYTFTKQGFEQDIILRQQPPSPTDYGLNPDTTKLEVLTEFIEPPVPEKATAEISDPTDERTGDTPLTDESLDFGAMKMGHGKAFAIGSDENIVRVGKNWSLLEGRHFLVENVKYHLIKDQLKSLPPASPAQTNRTASLKRSLPARMAQLAKPQKGAMLMAKADFNNQPGFVLDYFTVSSASDFVFKGDSTYFIKGTVNLSTATIEGGAVIKYTNYIAGSSLGTINVSGAITCLAESYHPAIFTAMDDNSVGEVIAHSTGSPSGKYAFPALNLGTDSDLSNLHFRYAQQAVACDQVNLTLRDMQFIGCSSAVQCTYANISLLNALATDFDDLITGGSFSADIEHLTGHNGLSIANVDDPYDSYISFENTLLVDVPEVFRDFAGEDIYFYTPEQFFQDSGNSIFQSSVVAGVEVGSHYLNGNQYRHIGTSNIDPGLKKRLAQKTTQPPIVLASTITVDTTLTAGDRDTDTHPDIGYHYDALDYAANNVSVNNATISLTGGVGIAVYGGTGFVLQGNSQIVSTGSATRLNHIVQYNAVQEQAVRAGTGWPATPFQVSASAQLSFLFSDVSIMANSLGNNFLISGVPSVLSFENSRISGGTIFWEFDGGDNSNPGDIVPVLKFKNNLIEHCYIDIIEGLPDGGSGGYGIYVNWNNNLFRQGTCSLAHNMLIESGQWIIENNFFDGVLLSDGSSFPINNSHNAYRNTTVLPNSSGGDQTSLSTFTFSQGLLGRYYQPSTGNPLQNQGSVLAKSVGLYHFTATTDQAIEGDSIVDIGLHYVACDSNGNPLDQDKDGIANYLEDRNGNGLADAGETDWMNPDTDYDGVNDGQEFSDGTDPLNATDNVHRRLGYWRFNYSDLMGEQGQLPVQALNVQTLTSWSGKAVEIDNAATANLNYKDVEANLNANINCKEGSVRFWFQPNWDSGVGPGTEARLIEVGTKDSVGGWWALMLNETGTEISFVTQGGGVSEVHFSTHINWHNGEWHQVVLTYDSNAIQLFIDGVPATVSEAPLYSFPDQATRHASGINIGSDAQGNNQARGQFDELETFNYALDESTEIISNYVNSLVPNTTCVTPAGLVSWWKAEGDATDAIGGANGNNNGATYVAGEVGSAFQFNGSTSVVIADRPAFNPTKAMTVEAWIYATSYPAFPAYDLISKDGESLDRQFILTIDSASPHKFRAHIGLPSGLAYFNGNTTVPLNTWTHVAMTYDGAALKLYVNGVLDGSLPVTGDIITTTQPIRIGGGAPAGNSPLYFPGKIDEVGFYNLALSAGAIQDIYAAGAAGKCGGSSDPAILVQPADQTVAVGENADFHVVARGTGTLTYQWYVDGNAISGATLSSLSLTSVQEANDGLYTVTVQNSLGSISSAAALLLAISPDGFPVPAGAVSWWQGQNNANDTIGNNHGTLVGGAGYAAGKVGNAFNFNGDGQYVMVPASASLSPSGSFSIEGWIYPLLDDDGVVIVGKWGDDGDYFNSRSYVLALIPGAKLQFGIADEDHQWDGAFHAFNTAENTVALNQWNHVAAVYDQATGTRRMYVNGVKVAERTDDPITVLDTTVPLSIGARMSSSTDIVNQFYGKIDEIAFYSRALTDTEISSIYAGSTAGKTASIPTFSPDGGTYTYVGPVTVSCDTPGAVIHYTLNGNEPTISDPIIASGATVSVNWSLTLKAKAFWGNASPSPTKSSDYTLTGAISGGGNFSLALRSDGTVYSWGNNTFGTLGNGTTTARSTIGPVQSLSGVSAISAGGTFALALKPNGTVWAWGDSSENQLGVGTVNHYTPVQVTSVHVVPFNDSLTGVKAISAGRVHSLALKSDGRVVAWGENFYGQLGDGTSGSGANKGPLYISGISHGLSASAGFGKHSLAVVETPVGSGSGAALVWGDNSHSQIGVSGVTLATSPLGIANLVQNVVSVSAGQNSSLALKSDGTIWGWGGNSAGELGIGTTSARLAPAAQAGGSSYSAVSLWNQTALALKTDGTVWVWGANGRGQFGNGTTTSSSTPAQVPGLGGIIAVSSGFGHSMALGSDGTVWTWGENDYTELGNGTGPDVWSPAKVNGLHLINWDDRDYDGIPSWQELLNGTDPNDAASVQQQRLGYWRFSDSTFVGEAGQRPRSFGNVQSVAGWSGNALVVDSASPATLKYNDVEIDGTANINCRNGSVRFWFAPDWASVAAGGSGPGVNGKLISVGSGWELALDSQGNNISFSSGGSTLLTAGISWTANQWHQVCLTYGPTGTALYIDGAAVATGAGVINYPDASTRATAGLNVGSDNAGTAQAKGKFDELETFNYPLTSANVSAGYGQDSNANGIPDWWEIRNLGTLSETGTQDDDGDGLTNLQEYKFGTSPGMADVNPPVFNPPAGAYNTPENISIFCSTPGAVIHYTLNGNVPTETDPILNGGATISVGSTAITIKARAWKTGMNPSQVVTAAYQPAVALPTFSSDSGTYAVGIQVTISCKTPGTTIRYTTDGTTPTVSSPTFDPQTPLVLNSTTTLKAIAWANGAQSGIREAHYNIVTSAPANDEFANAQLLSGVKGRVFGTLLGGSNDEEWDLLGLGGSSSVWYKWVAPAAGACHFESTPSIGVWAAADLEVFTGTSVEDLVTISALPSKHPTQATFTADAGTTYYVRVSNWTGNDEPFLLVWDDGTVAPPTASPDTGTYTTRQSVALLSATPGAVVHYTINGTTPTEDDPICLPGSTVTILQTTTLKAMAWKDGLGASALKSATYTIDPNATSITPTEPVPTISPLSGTDFAASLSITLNCVDSSATIHYTLDGTEPTEADTAVTPGSSITISDSAILKAKAWHSGANPSATQTGIYAKTGVDTDLDGLPDVWEMQNGSNMFLPDANAHSPNPNVHNLTNLQLYNNPNLLTLNYSTANDGIPDWWKLQHGYSPSSSSSTVGDNGLTLGDDFTDGLDPDDEDDRNPDALDPVYFNVVNGPQGHLWLVLDNLIDNVQKYTLYCTDQNGYTTEREIPVAADHQKDLHFQLPDPALGVGAWSFELVATDDKLNESKRTSLAIPRVKETLDSDSTSFYAHLDPWYPQNQLVVNDYVDYSTLKEHILIDKLRSANGIYRDLAQVFDFNDGITFSLTAPSQQQWWGVGAYSYADDTFVSTDDSFPFFCSTPHAYYGCPEAGSLSGSIWDVGVTVDHQQHKFLTYGGVNSYGLNYISFKIKQASGTQTLTVDNPVVMDANPTGNYVVAQETEVPLLKADSYAFDGRDYPVAATRTGWDYWATTFPEGNVIVPGWEWFGFGDPYPVSAAEPLVLATVGRPSMLQGAVKMTVSHADGTPIPDLYGIIEVDFDKAFLCDPTTGTVPRTQQDNVGGKKKIDLATATTTGIVSPNILQLNEAGYPNIILPVDEADFTPTEPGKVIVTTKPDSNGNYGEMVVYSGALETKDKVVHGVIPLFDSSVGRVDLSIRNANSGQDLGTYNDITSATPRFHIYNNEDDVLSEDELIQIENGTFPALGLDQPVVFVKDATNPHLLHFYTVFDDYGTVVVKLKAGAREVMMTKDMVEDRNVADMLTFADKRIESPYDDDDVVAPDFDSDGDGIPDYGPGGDYGMLVGQQPGTMAAPGAFVSEQDEDDSNNLLMVVDSDTSTTVVNPTDDKVVKINIKRPAFLTANVGTITLTVSDPSVVRVFKADGSALLNSYSVNLASPSGDLNGLIGGSTAIFLQGIQAKADLEVKVSYKDAGGVEQSTDSVHIKIVPAGSLSLLNYSPLMPSRDANGARFTYHRTYAANGAQIKSPFNFANVGVPEQAGPIKNRGRVAKAFINLFKNTINPPLALVRGFVDGVIAGGKGDYENIKGMLNLLTSKEERAAVFKAIFSLDTYKQMPNMIRNALDSFISDAEKKSVTFTFGEEDGTDDLSLSFYVAGYTMGYATEQIVFMYVGGGLVSKVGSGLKAVLLASKTGRIALAGVTLAQKFKTRCVSLCIQAAKKVLFTEQIAKAIGEMATALSKVTVGTRTVGEIIGTYVENISAIYDELIRIGKPLEDFGVRAQAQLAELMDKELGYFPGEKAMRGHLRAATELLDAENFDLFIKGNPNPSAFPALDKKKLVQDLEHIADEPVGEFRIFGVGSGPREVWNPNLSGLIRGQTDVIPLARYWGVEIPDDIVVHVIPAVEISAKNASGSKIWATYGSFYEHQYPKGIAWKDFYKSDGKIHISLAQEAMNSDEAIVALMAHEMHELNGLRLVFKEDPTPMKVRTLAHFIYAEGTMEGVRQAEGVLHVQAWTIADKIVKKMRRLL